MSHLNDVGLSYTEHMRRALAFSWTLLKSSFVLLLHAVFPDFMSNYASSQLTPVFKELSLNGHRILVRFNTKWEKDLNKRTWRVLVDGTESLASDVTLNVPTSTIQEDVSGVPKWHMLCHGYVVWNGDKATIRSYSA